jgi:hypothetical protein
MPEPPPVLKDQEDDMSKAKIEEYVMVIWLVWSEMGQTRDRENVRRVQAVRTVPANIHESDPATKELGLS